jgi:hypothetical protein
MGFGAEVAGFDPSAPLSESDCNGLQRVKDQSAVLVFRGACEY